MSLFKPNRKDFDGLRGSVVVITGTFDSLPWETKV